MKNILYKIFSCFAVFGVMTIIFYFSSQTAEVSDSTSGGFIEVFAKWFFSGFADKTPEEQQLIIDSLQGIVRTLAHFSIYFCLGLTASNLLFSFKIRTKPNLLISPAFCLLYAISDEIHQYFVPGRAFQISDLIVDTLGAVAGVFGFMLLLLIIKKIAKKISSRKEQP